MGYQMVTCPMTSRDPEKVKVMTTIRLDPHYLENSWICSLATITILLDSLL